MASSDSKTPNENVSKQETSQEFKFIYKDTEYDCTEYAQKHPGGLHFFEKMKDEKSDITEYFRTLHSKKALKILKSFPKTQTNLLESKDSVLFTTIKRKVKHLFEPHWPIEMTILLVSFSVFLLGAFTSNPILGIILIGINQNLAGWIGHSQNHSRNPILYKIGTIYGGIVAGLSSKWWNRKHNLHHMFTNNISKDEDIQHSYNRWLFPLLFPKWKFDSLVAEFGYKEFAYLAIHWAIIVQQTWWVVLIAHLIAGFLTAVILVGNHEKETIFEKRIDLPFFQHQITATTNYDYKSVISMIFMGGMQYQTEHHFFPQIPFYYLPKASEIINNELKKHNLVIKYSPIWQ
ncbi:hypothetical protein ABPG72_019627 [Tetrahymena utriculariae]